MNSQKKKRSGPAQVAQAPIYGASPNNADDDATTPASHSQPPPQTGQRLGAPSSTTYLGSLKNKDKAGTSIKNDCSDNESGRGSKAPQDPRIAQASHLFHIDLNVDNQTYSRDAGGANAKNSAPYLDRPRTTSPDEYRRRSTSITVGQSLNRVPEEMETPPTDADTDQQPHTNTAVGGHQYYGSVGYGTAPTRNGGDSGAGPRYLATMLIDNDDSEDEEEEEWILDEELAREGLYRGSYKHLIVLYTLVPLSTLLVFVLLALLAIFAFPSSSPSQFPYSPFLPFPLPEIVTAMALWSLSYLLRDFLYATSLTGANLVPFPSHRFPTFIPVLTSVVSALLQTAYSFFFRQLAIPILLIPYYSTENLGLFQQPSFGDQQQAVGVHKRHFPTWQDDAFRRVWWVALGWAAAEAVVGIKQGYESIALYKDVLVDVKKNPINKTETTIATGESRIVVEDPVSQVRPSNNRGASSRTATPMQNRIMDDMTLTPTQRDWETRQRTVEANSGIHTSATVSTQPRREHSSSLSSLTSNSNSHDPFQDPLVGERHPLLKVPIDPLIVGSQQTNEGDRWLVENEVERDLDELMALKSREELEEVYGIPVIRIPVFISCLHRINSILSSLGVCLLLTAAYMRSSLAYHTPSTGLSPTSLTLEVHSFQPSNRSLALTLPPLLILQSLLAMMHTPWILPRIGIHTFVYVGLLASLGLFFGGLGVWEALT